MGPRVQRLLRKTFRVLKYRPKFVGGLRTYRKMTTRVSSSDQDHRDSSVYDNQSHPIGVMADVVFCDDGPNGCCVGQKFPGLSLSGEMILLHKVRDADRDREDEGEAYAYKNLRALSSWGTKTRFFRATDERATDELTTYERTADERQRCPNYDDIPPEIPEHQREPTDSGVLTDPRGPSAYPWGSTEPPVDEIVRRPCGSRLGVTKWFSDRLGYGFITDISGPDKGVDLFTHFTSIRPLNNTRRTLHKGEYVSFDVGANCGGVQAVFVTGVLGGPLMCDQSE